LKFIKMMFLQVLNIVPMGLLSVVMVIGLSELYLADYVLSYKQWGFAFLLFLYFMLTTSSSIGSIERRPLLDVCYEWKEKGKGTGKDEE